jgi:type IV pilus assembly protein PilW
MSASKIRLKWFFQAGLSLIELMISLLLGSILIVGVIAVFDANRKVMAVSYDLNDLQDNAQTALYLMSEQIRMADYWGGVPSDRVRFNVDPLGASSGKCSTAWVFQSLEALRGYAGSSSIGAVLGLPKGCIKQNYLPESDLLAVRYADSRDLYKDTEIDNKKQSRRYFVRADVGVGAYVFNGRQYQSALNYIASNNTVYNMAFQASLFYLEACSSPQTATGLTPSPCEGQAPTLTRLSLSGNRFVKQSLVEGIEQLKFEYGIDSDQDGLVDRYHSAEYVAEWRAVLSVRISLLVRTSSKDREVDEAGKEYVLGGGQKSSAYVFKVENDAKHYRRKLYQQEIALRNRLNRSALL